MLVYIMVTRNIHGMNNVKPGANVQYKQRQKLECGRFSANMDVY
jgi:hypothetical protein